MPLILDYLKQVTSGAQVTQIMFVVKKFPGAHILILFECSNS